MKQSHTRINPAIALVLGLGSPFFESLDAKAQEPWAPLNPALAPGIPGGSTSRDSPYRAHAIAESAQAPLNLIKSTLPSRQVQKRHVRKKPRKHRPRRRILAWTRAPIPIPISRPREIASYAFDGSYAGLAAGTQSVELTHQTSSYGALVRFEPYPDASRHGAAGFWGFAGYNRKFKALVAGLEADFGYAKPPPIQQKSPYGTLDPRTFGFNASFRARLGLALFDRVMIYGTGGVQLAAIRSQQDANPATRIYPGWTVGAGIEAFLTPTISVRAEYLRSHFPSPGIDAHTIRAGVAIKF
jgi:opacity protein-like surface antigen